MFLSLTATFLSLRGGAGRSLAGLSCCRGEFCRVRALELTEVRKDCFPPSAPLASDSLACLCYFISFRTFCASSKWEKYSAGLVACRCSNSREIASRKLARRSRNWLGDWGFCVLWMVLAFA